MPPRKEQQDFVLSDDDIDELESQDGFDEEEVKPGTGPFTGALVKPRHVTVACRQLYELIHKGTVDLQPAYQRDVVWTHAKMIGLIQSLYLNFYIPPVIFAMETDEQGEELRVSIDGKQRCSSIIAFMDGAIPYISPATGEKYWYRKVTPGQRGQLCTPAMKSRFDMIQLQAVEYDGISDEVQRDIFQRVQMGTPLTAAEKLQAIPSPTVTWLMEMVKKYVAEDDTLADKMNWDVTRGRPFQHFASMTYICWYTDSRSPVSSNVLKKWLEGSTPLDEGFKKKMEMVMSLLVTISADYGDIAFAAGDGKAVPPRVAPVELWFMGYIIFCRMGSTSIIGLARQISEMRRFTRKTHKDVFTNAKVVSSIYKWFDGLKVEKPGPGQQVAAVEWEGEDPQGSATLAKKRKRAQREEDDDPDYRGTPNSRTGRSTSNGSAVKTRTASAPTPVRSTHTRPPQPPAPVAQRPSVSSMDAPRANPNFGQASQGGVSPYGSQTHVDPRAYQRPNGIYGPPPTSQSNPSTYNAAALQQQAQQRVTNQVTWLPHNTYRPR